MTKDYIETKDYNEYEYCIVNGKEVHITEYKKLVEQGEGSWDFYSDWHKDVYGFRPR